MPRTEEEINNLLGTAAIPKNYYESLKPQYGEFLLNLIENESAANFIAGYPNGPTIILAFIARLDPQLGEIGVDVLSTILEQQELRNTINKKGSGALDLLCNFISVNVHRQDLNSIQLKQDTINYLIHTIPVQRPSTHGLFNTTPTPHNPDPNDPKSFKRIEP
ncbi:hypothetical protein ACQUW5_09015 [Legionella sp. CNM-1927-20]|uniref:hypothetical protein n=1 Tax=Legionella sp. CNM-1927-20 TaxID=3422221 RepID=UPI00403A9394